MAPRHLRQKKEARSILKSSVLMLFNSRADFKLKPNVRAEPKQQEDGCVLRQDQDGAHKSSHSFRQVLAGLAGGLVRRNSDCVSLDSLRTALPRARSVSFDEVVKERYVETRKQLYSDPATKRNSFYSHAELETFKRAWYGHIETTRGGWPIDGLLKCGCSRCDIEEETSLKMPEVGQDENFLEDYTTWTWEG